MNIWEIKEEIDKRNREKRVLKYGDSAISEVYEFCQQANMLRTPENCTRFFNNKYDINVCSDIIQYLFDTRKMGAYYFGKGKEPQPYMKQFILDNYPEINEKSFIMEVGPGDLPLFDEKTYSNWCACDINYADGVINFSDHVWGKDMYTKIYSGGWENILEVCKINDLGAFDLVCGSHSFEHNHMPIKALKQTADILKDKGLLVLFVPDGNSTWSGNYDKTHSMYLTEEMIKDIFGAVPQLSIIKCEQFRKNMDLVVVARKK
jgi:SAM-dependent methyltransferase